MLCGGRHFEQSGELVRRGVVALAFQTIEQGIERRVFEDAQELAVQTLQLDGRQRADKRQMILALPSIVLQGRSSWPTRRTWTGQWSPQHVRKICIASRLFTVGLRPTSIAQKW